MSKKNLMDEVLGHHAMKLKLAELVAKERLSPLNLFVGPSGVGKKQMARALVQSLVCEKSRRACGECGPCQRIVTGQSESLLVIEPDGLQIKIEQAHEVREYCQLRHPGKCRAIIIDQAERLNTQASNALLKVFEEPPAHTYFFLTAPSPQAVLPTIRSRSQVFRFGVLQVVDLQKQGIVVEDWILRSSGGRMDRIEALQSEELQVSRQKAVKLFTLAWGQQMDLVRENLKDWSPKREEALWLAKFWREFIRDAWLSRKGLGPLMHQDLKEDFYAQLGGDDAQFSRLSLRAQALENGLMANYDTQINLEAFLNDLD